MHCTNDVLTLQLDSKLTDKLACSLELTSQPSALVAFDTGDVERQTAWNCEFYCKVCSFYISYHLVLSVKEVLLYTTSLYIIHRSSSSFLEIFASCRTLREAAKNVFLVV